MSVDGERATVSRYVCDQAGAWGEDGWWTPGEDSDHERMTLIDVTTSHRGWLYKVLLSTSDELTQDHETGALATVLESWQWEAIPDTTPETGEKDGREAAESILPVAAWNEQCSAFTLGVPAGWRQLTPRELERASPLKEERVWAGIVLAESPASARIEITAHPGRLDSVVDGLMDEASAATSSVSLVDGPQLLDIGGRPAASLHYVCLAYDNQRTRAEADATTDDQLPNFVSLSLLLVEWEGWVYRIRMYCEEQETPRHVVALSTVVRTWQWRRT